jgi:hypothetical protein
VSHRLPHALAIARTNQIHLQFARGTVNRDYWDSPSSNCLIIGPRLIAGYEDQTSRSLTSQYFQLLLFPLCQSVRIPEQQGIACAVKFGFDSVNDAREERVLQIRYDHPDHFTATEAQASREAVWVVIEFRNGPSDTITRFPGNSIQTG